MALDEYKALTECPACGGKASSAVKTVTTPFSPYFMPHDEQTGAPAFLLWRCSYCGYSYNTKTKEPLAGSPPKGKAYRIESVPIANTDA